MPFDLRPSDGNSNDPLILLLARLFGSAQNTSAGAPSLSAEGALGESLFRAMREAAETNPARRGHNNELMRTPEGRAELTEQMDACVQRIPELVALLSALGVTITAEVIDVPAE